MSFVRYIARAGALAVVLSLAAACASVIVPLSSVDAGPGAEGDAGAPAEDAGALAEDGGPAAPDGGLEADGGASPDGGRDDRVWAAPVFNLRAPSDLQDPDTRVNVYFSPTEDVRGVVLRELDATRQKAHVAMFSIGDARVAAKLLAMRNAGLEVRILWDGVQADSNASDDLYRVLVDGGVEVAKIRVDGGSALASMHDKFAVLDDARVLTGSMNWSVTGLSQNHEHLLTIAGGVFPARFDAAWQTIAGGGRAATVYDPDAGLNVQFGPGNRLDQAVIQRIRAARRSIFVAMFDLSNADLVNELVAARARGVSVVMVVDKNQSDDTLLDEAFECGATVRDGGLGDGGLVCPDGGAARGVVLRANTGSVFVKMHQKYQVYDDEYVIAGSFNWTNLATYYNHENLVEVRSARLAQRFMTNFLDLLQRFDPTYTNPAQPPARYGFTPGAVQVTLEVPEPRLREGDALFVGGDPPLGGWQRGQALPMTRRADGTWETTVTVPAGVPLEYKFLVRDRFGDIRWEGGPKHVYTPVFSPAAQRASDLFRSPPEGY